jgi:hypothetical protein
MEQHLSLITLGVGDVSRARHSTRPSAGTWSGGWRPCARRRPDQPRVAANRRVPSGLVAGAKAAATLAHGD